MELEEDPEVVREFVLQNIKNQLVSQSRGLLVI
jgi:hypothetical protein